MKRAAIVGCGGISAVHAAVLNALEGVKLVACADIRPERAEAMAEKYGLHAYDSLESMLDAEQIDVLHICTPHYLHVPMAAEAHRRGIHVFTEKPPAISKEQEAELFAIASDGGARIGVCFQNRYIEAARKLKSMVDSGETGRILGIRGFVTWARDERYYVESGWRGKLATEG
ncbi:MAG: Gfo/Idh/MocA family oxidoreductase, partial [Oscillospiraceae bacterium]|nr:Gfo/Idh/MocA family oxidoreductase [Oscillospiraceae bacterium]